MISLSFFSNYALTAVVTAAIALFMWDFAKALLQWLTAEDHWSSSCG